MAALVLDNPVVSVNGITWPFVNQISINRSRPVTAYKTFGTVGQQQAISTQSEDSFTLRAIQGGGTAELGALIEPIYGTLATVVVTQNAGSVTAENPSYTAVCAVAEYNPVDGEPGDLVQVPMTWPVNGQWARATS